MVRFSHARFISNSADSGGAIYASSGKLPLLVLYSTFSGNSAYDFHGGAIYSEMGDVRIKFALFIGNTAAGNGGAVYSSHDSLSISSSTMSNNAAYTSDHVFTQAMTYVKIADTGFSPFVDRASASVQIAGVLATCEQHPCRLAQRCRHCRCLR